MFLAKHGIVGVVVTSTGTLCHACVLCSSTSVGRQSLQNPVQIACHLRSTESTPSIVLLHYRSKNTCWHCHPALNPTQFTHDLLVRIYFMLMKKTNKTTIVKKTSANLQYYPHTHRCDKFICQGQFFPCYSLLKMSVLCFIQHRSQHHFFKHHLTAVLKINLREVCIGAESTNFSIFF